MRDGQSEIDGVAGPPIVLRSPLFGVLGVVQFLEPMWTLAVVSSITFRIDAKQRGDVHGDSLILGHLDSDEKRVLVWSREGIERDWPIAIAAAPRRVSGSESTGAFGSQIMIGVPDDFIVFAVHPGDDELLLMLTPMGHG